MATACGANRTMSLLSLVERGDREGLLQLLESISASNSTKEFGERNAQNLNAVDLAALLGRQELLELLLDHGADVNSTNKSGSTSICTNQLYYMTLLGYSAMHYSAAWGKLECLQLLAEKGAEYNLTRYKETPKDIAIRYGQKECVNFLIFHGEASIAHSESKR